MKENENGTDEKLEVLQNISNYFLDYMRIIGLTQSDALTIMSTLLIHISMDCKIEKKDFIENCGKTWDNYLVVLQTRALENMGINLDQFPKLDC